MNAQDLKTGAYYPNPANKQFEGTWVYSQGQDTLKVVLTSKKQFVEKLNLYTDFLEGNYYYIKGGKVVANKINTNQNTIQYGVASKEESSIATATFNDFNRGKTGSLKLELLSGEANMLRWHLSNREAVLVNGKKWDNSFDVPINVILKRIDD